MEEVQSSDAIQNSTGGLFEDSLKRNFKQIREDRANIMMRSTISIYKGDIDKLFLELDKLEIDRNNALDFAGDSTTRIISLEKYDAQSYVDRDKEITMQIREVNVKIEEYTKRFKALFGREYKRDY